MQWTSGSASHSSTSEARRSISSGDSALRASGRLSRAIATAPSRSARTTSSATTSLDHRVHAGCGATDDQLLDLRGALVQGGDPRVAEVALHRVIVHVA